ncbi:hypothetical protein HDU81_001031, partial [Chytriomyces hyalinus]
MLDDTEAQYLNVGNGDFQLLTEVMGVLVSGAVTELEAWEAWKSVGVWIGTQCQ